METNTPTRRAAALPPEERRAAIVEATKPLLAEFGELVTSRQIAAAAGVAEGTIFRAFADKDELLSATLEAAMDLGPLEAALLAIDRTLPFEQQLVVATAVIQERVVGIWQLVSNLGPKLREQAARPLSQSDALVALFEPMAEHLNLEPVDAARLLRGLTLSMTHSMLGSQRMTPEQIVTFYLHGAIGAGPHASKALR